VLLLVMRVSRRPLAKQQLLRVQAASSLQTESLDADSGCSRAFSVLITFVRDTNEL
jgi:hypothetical protein